MSRVLGLLVVAACSSEPEPPPPGPTAPTVVSLTFDDTFADNLHAVAMLEERGMRGTFFVNSSRIDRPDFFTGDQLREMQAAGHEIGGHTVHHANVRWIDPDEARRQICDDRVALLAHGFAATTFAYPFSGNDEVSRQIVADCGYAAARIVGGIGPSPTCVTCPLTAPPAPLDPYRIPTNDSVHVGTTLAMLQGYVEQAEQHGGGWVPIVFHHVCDGCNELAIAPALLEAFLDWLEPRAAHGTTVATMRAVLGTTEVSPGVRGPAPEEARDAYNVLMNASLERDRDFNGVPDCWQRGGSGDNTASYALTSRAADGAVAQRIDITAWNSGTRRLVSAQDLGGCARVIDPLRAYHARARYVASSPVRFSAYVRRAEGWEAFAQGPTLPPAASYTEATYALPALPADANGVSIGLTLLGPGSLTMDALWLSTDGRVDAVHGVHSAPGYVSETVP